MPIAKIQMPDGRIARFEVPEGTTQEQVMSFVESNQSQFSADNAQDSADVAQAGADVQVGADQAIGIPAIESSFSQETYDMLSKINPQQAQAYMSQSQQLDASKRAELEREAKLNALRESNPGLADVIEGMSTTESFLTGTGKGLTDLGRGAARIFGADPVSEQQKGIDDALTQTSKAANVGQFVGQAAPFAAASVLTGGIAGLAGRAAATGVLGATEGGLVASGKGGDAKQIATSTAIGGALGVLGEVGASGANRLVRKFLDKAGKRIPAEAKLITPQGTATPELQKVLSETGKTLDDVIREGAEDQTATAITKAGRSKVRASARVRQVAKNTEIDNETIEAMQKLGLNPDDAPIGMLAKDQGTKEISGAVSAVPGSESNAQYNAFMRSVIGDLDQGTKGVANETIEKLKGRIDTGTYSDEIMGEIDNSIQVVKKAENTAYDKARQAMDDSTLVNVKPARNVLEAARRRLKATKLDGADAAVYKVVKQPKVTYADLDNLRKQIGSGMSRQGRFKDADQAKLSLWYGRLSDLQEGAASQVNKEAGELIRNAKSLSRDRFALQESSTALFGKDGVADIFPKLEGELKKAAGKGGLKKFKSIMSQVPEKHRQSVVASALKGVFTSRQGAAKTFTPSSFNDWMTALKRDPKGYNEVMKYLPAQGKERLESMHKLSKAITDVTRNMKPTGVTPDEFRRLDQNGMIKRLISGVAKRGADIATGGTTGGGAGDIVTQMATSSRAKDAADAVLTSPEFRSTIKAAISKGTKSNQYNRALTALKKNKAYKDYMGNLDSSSSGAILASGLIPYVLSGEKTE